MNKKLTPAGASLSPVSYVSPTAIVKEIQAEGVLCMSINAITKSEYGFQDWEERDFTW